MVLSQCDFCHQGFLLASPRFAPSKNSTGFNTGNYSDVLVHSLPFVFMGDLGICPLAYPSTPILVNSVLGCLAAGLLFLLVSPLIHHPSFPWLTSPVNSVFAA